MQAYPHYRAHDVPRNGSSHKPPPLKRPGKRLSWGDRIAIALLFGVALSSAVAMVGGAVWLTVVIALDLARRVSGG